MPKIFISYRREDAPGQAGRLYDRLKQEFGDENVFIDVDTLLPGDDFIDAIGQTLGRCDLMIAVIGPGWLSATDKHGRVRLQDPADFVRVEVQTALDRHVRTVPVLVNHGAMPLEDQLPEPLKPLTRRQAIELSDVRWASDVGALVEKVKRATSGADPRPVTPQPPAPKRRLWPMAAAAAAVIASGVAGVVFMRSNAPRVAQSAPPSTTVAARTEPPALPAAAEKPAAPKDHVAKATAPASRGIPPAPAAAAPVPAARAAAAPADAAPASSGPAPAAPRRAAVSPAVAPTPVKPTVRSCRDGETDPTRCSAPCEAGDIRSCVNLGFMYEVGRGVAKDPQRAVSIYQHWCSTNDQYACAHLGRTYVLGSGGLARNDARAFQLFNTACDANVEFACAELGVMYSSGLSVPRDEARAAGLFQRSCDAAVGVGCANLGLLTMTGRGGVTRDEGRAVALFQRGCDGGSPAGCGELGLAYHRGRGGLVVDETRAATLFQRACGEGYLLGCSNLGVLYVNGLGLPKDVPRGMALYERACDGGTALACANLARLYERGILVNKDPARAASYYQRACSIGDKQACESLQTLGKKRR